jgi:site-specific recombinase XerD
MNDKQLAEPWVRRFLLEYLVAERNLSGNTQASYRDTLTLLLPFASASVGHAIDRMTVEDLTPSIVRRFLDHLERDRHCSGVTRNQRLAMIHSLARFIGTHSPVHLAWCTELRSIPFKKTAKTSIGYLEKHEIDALLNQPDPSMKDVNDFGKSIHPGQIQALQHQRCILFQDQNEKQTRYFGTLLHGCVPGFLRIFKSSTRLYLRSGF